MTYVDYMEDFIVYDSYHNTIRDKTSKEGFMVQWNIMPNQCDRYKLYTKEWQECVCVERVSGDAGAAKLVAMYRNNVPIDVIMQHFNLSSPSCIYIILRLYGLEPRKQYNSRGRLTSEELEQIRQLYERGESIYSIAKKLNRPTSTIYYALKRMGYKR